MSNLSIECYPNTEVFARLMKTFFVFKSASNFQTATNQLATSTNLICWLFKNQNTMN